MRWIRRTCTQNLEIFVATFSTKTRAPKRNGWTNRWVRWFFRSTMTFPWYRMTVPPDWRCPNCRRGLRLGEDLEEAVKAVSAMAYLEDHPSHKWNKRIPYKWPYKMGKWGCNPTYRGQTTCEICKWLITMVRSSPLTGLFLPNGHSMAYI